MAESYRGLTIRIGGDTTKLNQALHTTNQAISGTQSSMRKLSDALKFDPTSLKASQLQVGEFASQAANAASRLVVLNDAMHQVSDEVKVFNGTASTVRALADSWGNVNMVASQTRDYYAALTRTLATTYTEFSNVYSEASKMASVKMTEDWELGKTGLDQMLASVKEMSTQFNANDKQVERFVNRITSLQERYDKLATTYAEYQHAVATETDTAKFTKAAQNLEVVRQKMEKVKESFQSYIASFKGFKSDEVFKFDADNTDLASLAKSLYQIVQAGAMTVEQADKMYDSFARMKDEWDTSFTNVQTANVVEGLHDLEAEAAKAEAKVASLVKQLVEAARSDATQGIAKLDEKLKSVSDSGDAASTRLKQALEVIKHSFDNGGDGPTSGQMTDAMRSYADAVDYASNKVNVLEQEVLKLGENEAVSNLAGSTRSLVDESDEAEQSYNDMAEAVTRYEAALNKVEEEQLRIKEDNPQYEQDERYQELTKQAEAYHQILEITYASADVAKQKFTEMTQALVLRDKLHDLEIAKAALQQLQEMKIRPEVDISALDGLKKTLDAISKGTFSTDGVGKFREAVKDTASVMADAEKRYRALSEAAKKDPTNSETLRMRTAAFDEVVRATVAHIDAMKKELAAIPSDRVDQAALAAGTAQQNYRKAKEEVDKWGTSLKDLDERIDEVTQERQGVLDNIINSNDVLLVSRLTRSLEELKQRRDAVAAANSAAIDNLAIAENTRQVEEHTVAIQQDEARLHEFGNEARNVGKLDATPNIDEAAFIQVVDRVAQAARRMASEVVQASNEIDSAYRDMRKTVNGTEEDYERLRDAAIEYSKDSFTSADQMLEMQALGGQLGVATENLEQFGKIASNLDIATDIDAETVALKLGQISNILQLDIDGMQGFSDALVRLGNNMPAQESAIMAVAQRFGAVAATANFSGEEVLGWSAAIAATGQRSEAAATAISNTVSGIEQAVANGGSDLKQFAAIASMSADEFTKSWKESPTETLRAFIDGLRILKDSDESAVAALENMGITGVRQQQTLLALTQTIGNLDEALLMSRDAWNGISDQWGNAGDAAIEAGRKAEGFSGALQKMKNNAQNLAASMGDGLVDFMEAAADILGILTDALNAMPKPIKELIVSLGAAGIAFSTLNPMLTLFGRGIGSAIASFAQTATIGEFIAKMTGVEAAVMGAAEQGVNLVTLFNGPMVAGIAAVVAVLGLAVGAITEYSEKQEQFQQATIGLTTATQNAKTAYDEYVIGAQESTRSVNELKTAMDEATESQANLANQLKDAWGEIGASEATVDMMVSKIAELSAKNHLTTDEQNELNAAVQTFNNLTGNNVQILNGENGELDTTIGRLRSMAEGWKDATEEAQHLKDYSEVAQELAEKQKLLTEVQEKLGDSSRKQGQWFTDMRDTANSTTGSYDTLAAEAQQLEQEIAALETKMKESVGGMGDLGDEVKRVEDAFQATGDSLTNYGDFTDSELRVIVEAFNKAGDGSISALDRVKQAIEGLRSSANDASTIAREAEEASKEAAKARAEAFKTKATKEYNDLKRQLDNEYRAQQTAYNNQYNALKKQFDKVYNAKKKDYDDAYKQLKAQLDKEYKARKKANDDQLKALKKSQDAEVAAFKKATEARLKEMKKEYEQRVKLLELQYGKGTGDIDERIEALKAETDAEKKSIEERNEADKVAELQKAVDSANSRRKRAEAEKALNDYLQELEAERNAASREAEIERLEDQKTLLEDELAARKEVLKEEYDAEVEAYKLKREAELTALQEANTAEYEALQTALEAQLTALKEKQDERLAALKDGQDEQLQSLKDAQQAQLDALKQSQSDALALMKQNQQQQLQDLKASNDAQYKAIKAGRDKEAAAQKEHDANMLKELQDAGTNLQRITTDTANKMFGTVVDNLVGQDEKYGEYGEKSPESYKQGMDRTAAELIRGAASIANDALSPFDMNGEMKINGYHSLSGFNEGIVAEWNRGTLMRNINNITGWIHDRLGFSVPKYGPLSDADKWGPDMVMLIADGIKSKERVLLHQVERMSDAIEEAFDPTLTVDAAYEALDTIGKNRSKSLGAIVENNSAPSITIELNMNLSDVSFRSDADIDRLARVVSQEMAAQASRQLAGRLG